MLEEKRHWAFLVCFYLVLENEVRRRNAPNLHFFMGCFVRRGKKAIFDPILVPRSDWERSITSLPPGHQWSYLYCDNICRTQLELDPTSTGTVFHCVVAVAKSLCSKQTRQKVWGETTQWWQAYHPVTGKTDFETKPCCLFSDPWLQKLLSLCSCNLSCTSK